MQTFLSGARLETLVSSLESCNKLLGASEVEISRIIRSVKQRWLGSMTEKSFHDLLKGVSHLNVNLGQPSCRKIRNTDADGCCSLPTRGTSPSEASQFSRDETFHANNQQKFRQKFTFRVNWPGYLQSDVPRQPKGLRYATY